MAVLLANAEELAERTGIALNWEEDWAPWLDTSYLTAEARADPKIIANVRAIEEVCGLIAFVATDDEDQPLGYWRGPAKRRVAESPIVLLDNEGQFSMCAGSTLAEAILSMRFDEESFGELRDWFRSLGIAVQAEVPGDIPYPDEADRPDDRHQRLYFQYCG